MTYRGRVKAGIVILDEPTNLPDGAEVQVQAAEPATTGNVWEKLLALVGKAEGLPEDAAENLDHHLYGTPKR